MDIVKFNTARLKIIRNEHIYDGIGTLKEKMLHRIVKNYFEPNEDNHEIKIGNFIADISNENGIIEIQTGNFAKLRHKLDFFLKTRPVTIVYPVAYNGNTIWIDNFGVTIKQQKSRKKGKIYDIFDELYAIKSLLKNENLKICILLLNMDEYRSLISSKNCKRKRYSKFEKIPTNIIEELYINNINDYLAFLPLALENEFTVKDYKNATNIRLKTAGIALNILNYIGVVERVSKIGNAYVYRRADLV